MATDYFLKLDGIEGESQDPNHRNEIQLISFSFGVSNRTSVGVGGGSGAGKANIQDLHVTKYQDRASTKLFKALVTGQHIKSGTLTCNKAGGQGKPYLTYELTQVLVTSQTSSGMSEHSSESVSFSFAQMKMAYSIQNEQGNMASTGAVTYNVSQNKVS